MNNYPPGSTHGLTSAGVRSITTGSVGHPEAFQNLPRHPHVPNSTVVHRAGIPSGTMYGPITAWKPPVQAVGPTSEGIQRPPPGYARAMFVGCPEALSQRGVPGTQVLPPETPLDLSVKKKPDEPRLRDHTPSRPPVSTITSNASADDAPLDLSRPSGSSSSISQEVEPSGAVNMTGRPLSNSSVGGVSAGYQSSRSADSDQDRHSSTSNSTAIASLIGNHPVDDILYLHCTRCQSSYGSVHNFRKHFRNAHGYIPSSEDVFIQGIKATKEYVAKQQGNQGRPQVPLQTMLHCCYCGFQCEIPKQDQFNRHMSEHYENRSSLYKCTICRYVAGDMDALRDHLKHHAGICHSLCSLCTLAFQHDEQLSAHMLQSHGRALPSRQSHSAIPGKLTSPSTTSPKAMPGQAIHIVQTNSSSLNSLQQMSTSTVNYAMSQSAASARSPISPRPLRLPNQSLAEHIEAAVTRELSVGDQPPPQNMGDLLFMQQLRNGQPGNKIPGKTPPTSTPTSTSTTTSSSSFKVTEITASSKGTESSKNPLNLLSLLDRVVEHGLRNTNSNGSNKADLKFTVTFNTEDLASSSDEVSPKGKTQFDSKHQAPVSVAMADVKVESTSDSPEATTATTETVKEENSTHMKMVQKTIMQHIEDAVTRELTSYDPEPPSRTTSLPGTKSKPDSLKRTNVTSPAECATMNGEEATSPDTTPAGGVTGQPSSSFGESESHPVITTSPDSTESAMPNTVEKRKERESGNESDDSDSSHKKLKIIEEPTELEQLSN